MPPRIQVKAKRSAATPSVNVDDIIAKVSTAHRDDPIDSIMERKSRRNPALSYLEKPELRKLLSKILCDDKQTVVLKIKNEMPADVSSIQFDAILAALTHNSVCQALYIQNLSAAIRESQLLALIELLKKKSLIWCVNVGETYDIPLAIWQKFCDALPETAVTHLYVSEHVIPIQLKNDMRRHIRVNRTKHRLHCSRRNLSVIERCTNMWWNPINGVKLPPVKKLCSNPKDVAYWQQGVGEGGSTAWKFHCVPCGERCSSYEHWRYHPTGRMFECSQCHIWSHVNCTLSGRHYTDEDLEELVVSAIDYSALYENTSNAHARAGRGSE